MELLDFASRHRLRSSSDRCARELSLGVSTTAMPSQNRESN